MSPMRRDLDLYQRATMALSLIMVVLGALFVAAGAGRFWVARR
jgi:hypothetical protein